MSAARTSRTTLRSCDWAVRGQDPAEVIATVGSDGGLAFYVADDLSDSQQERLTTELSAGG